MRYVDLVLRPDPGWSPFGRVVEDDPDVTREAVHQLNLMEDDTAVMLYELSGEAGYIEGLLGEHFDAIAYETSRVDGNVLVYAHIQPTPLVQGLLQIPQSFSIVIDTPIEFTPDGGLKLTLVGEEGAIGDVMGAIPDAVNYTVEGTGDYAPGAERLFSELTDRQQEILVTALEMGYYERPRRATYEDIADTVGCTRTTVGEHLRKAEQKVLTGVVP